MRLETFVALRYLKARRKQAVISLVTFISILGVAAGVAALIVALALNTGFQREFQRRILGATSHVNLVGLGGSTVSHYEGLVEKIAKMPQVIAVSPTVYDQAILQSEFREQGATIKGISRAAAEESPELIPHIIEGDAAEFGRSGNIPGALLGKDLADALAVSAGESVKAVVPGGELSPVGRLPKVQDFTVLGIFESGLWEFDANFMLVPLGAAQKLASLPPDEVQSLELKITDLYQAPEVAVQVKKMAGPGYVTNTWIDLNRPLFSALRLEKLAMFIAIGLIVLVASLNIVGTLILMVMEKNRDIAIITAMGGTARTIMRVFMYQGLIIGAAGTIIGDVIGTLASWYFDKYKIFRLEPQVYSIPYVPFKVDFSDLVMVSLVAILISFLATLYPARAAARIDPIESLRYE